METTQGNSKMKSQRDLGNIEWMKTKLKTLWSSPKYCCLCLETSGNIFPLKIELAINEEVSSRPLREIVSSIFNCEIEDYTSSNFICEQCTEKTITSYIFIENTKKMFEILSNCVNDLHSKVTDLNNELGESCDYGDANVMIVVEYDKNTYNCVDELNCGNNTILTNTPIRKEKKPPSEGILPTVVSSKTQSNILTQNRSTERIKLEIKENKGPVIMPTPRVVKYPRSEFPKAKVKDEPLQMSNTPNVSLQDGKIVIAPLITNTPSIPRLFNTYKCEFCTDIFTTYRSLKEHEKTKHNTVVYKCRICNKIYNTQQYLDLHYTADHSKTRCKFCHELFDGDEFNKHLREQHEKLVHCCKYCDLVYYSVEQLETHFKASHLMNSAVEVAGKSQCVMCLRHVRDSETKTHRCKFSCLECTTKPCIHYSYLMSYREQVLARAPKIKCLDCDFTTKRKEQLIGHVNREHLDYHPFTCHECGTQFYTKLSLITHIIQFHQDLQCQYCDTEFKSKKLLKQHRDICKTIARGFSCEKCVASFYTQKELNKHDKQHHSEIVYPCSLCKKAFSAKLSLEEHHARIHSGIQYKKRRKFIECTLCDITFRNVKEMLDHEKLHDQNETFPCKVCPKSFSSLKKVYTHKQRHYSQRIKCDRCHKLISWSYFNQHRAVCHCSEGSTKHAHMCEVCGKSFHTDLTLRKHQLVHDRVLCELCNTHVKLASLNKHMEVRHGDVESQQKQSGSDVTVREKQLISCDYCGYLTKKRVDIENHINRLHLKIKPFTCSLCSKSFCGKARLAEHERTHSDTNVCYCNICGKKFANKVCLKMHTRRHTGEKPYQCNICFEMFRSSSIMKTHRLKKHQDRTVQCPICGSMYHLAAEMRFHVKKVHWKGDAPFDYKAIVPEEYHNLFEDRRLQKLGEDCITPKVEE